MFSRSVNGLWNWLSGHDRCIGLFDSWEDAICIGEWIFSWDLEILFRGDSFDAFCLLSAISSFKRLFRLSKCRGLRLFVSWAKYWEVWINWNFRGLFWMMWYTVPIFDFNLIDWRNFFILFFANDEHVVLVKRGESSLRRRNAFDWGYSLDIPKVDVTWSISFSQLRAWTFFHHLTRTLLLGFRAPFPSWWRWSANRWVKKLTFLWGEEQVVLNDLPPIWWMEHFFFINEDIRTIICAERILHWIGLHRLSMTYSCHMLESSLVSCDCSAWWTIRSFWICSSDWSLRSEHFWVKSLLPDTCWRFDFRLLRVVQLRRQTVGFLVVLESHNDAIVVLAEEPFVREGDFLAS